MSGLGGGRGWFFRSYEDKEKTRLVLSTVSPLGSPQSPCSWDPQAHLRLKTTSFL